MSEQENTNTSTSGLADENGNVNSQNADDAGENTDAGKEASQNTDAGKQDEQPQNKENTDNGSKATDDNSDIYGCPENYDFSKLNLPEGFQVDTELAEKFAPLGKKLNLSQQSANELANLLVESMQKQGTAVTEKYAELKTQEREATRLSYEKMLNTDAEIGGGDEDKMNAYLDIADAGYSAFATAGLKNALHDLSLDYHPEVVKLFHRLGKLCGKDSIQKPKAPAGTKLDAAEVLYGTKE